MQFSSDDLEAAVEAGILTPETAAGFRALVERRREATAADEESFRLLTGFNDIFVAIAVVMVLSALAWLGVRFENALGPALVALASWGLAEFFTRRRRMALPSLLLLLSFVGGVGFTAHFLSPFAKFANPAEHILWVGGLGGLAAFAHWRRFHVPITVAAGALTLLATGVALYAAATKDAGTINYAVLVAGLIAFALALAWDMSDPQRRTRRADVAFWLHLIAAPAIVHPAFSLLGLTRLSLFGLFVPDMQPEGGAASALGAFALYTLLGVIALIVDRRALMVSALAYLLFAMKSLLAATGALTVSIALSALVVGAGLLLLSAFWATARRAALRLAPEPLRRRLPPAA